MRNTCRQTQVDINNKISKYNKQESFILRDKFLKKINHKCYHILVYLQPLEIKNNIKINKFLILHLFVLKL